MKTRAIDVNVLRSEKRFMISLADLPRFLRGMSKILEPQVFSENQIARTIYFNNPDYPVPWGWSIKARRYLPDFSQVVFLNPRELYRLEIKTQKEGDIREKIQKELPLEEVPQFISEVAGLNLQPYAVDEYQRGHFVSRQNPAALRVTVDKNVNYGFLEDTSMPAIWVGDEEFARIEIKAAPEHRAGAEYQKVLQFLADFSVWPVISKREHALSLIGLQLDKKGRQLRKEITDCEIEAKFLVRHPDPAGLLLALKKHLQRGEENYEVVSYYPFTQEGATINHYWSRRDSSGQVVEGMKLMFIGQKVKPVFKKETQVWPDTDGLDCVLERKELKGQPFIFTVGAYDDFLRKTTKAQGQLNYVGYLSRSRRAFWPESIGTRRVFHISLDQCRSFDDRIEWQMEVEYTGRHVEHLEGNDSEKLKLAIQQEVTGLSREVLSFCNKDGRHLIPTTLTKFDWLKGY